VPVASFTSSLTQFVGDYGLYAVFVLMMIDAVFPAGSEIVMVYGGAIASGAIAGTSVTLFGYEFPSGLPAYLAIVVAGRTSSATAAGSTSTMPSSSGQRRGSRSGRTGPY